MKFDSKGRIAEPLLRKISPTTKRWKHGVHSGAFAFFLLLSATFMITLAMSGALKTVEKRIMDVSLGVVYRLDPELHGRTEIGPRCCLGKNCTNIKTGKVAVVTMLTNDAYFPLFQQLECTLRSSNPDLEFAVMTTPRSLHVDIRRLIDRLGVHVIDVEEIRYPNLYEERYSGNWLKLRAFELEQYDAIVLLDTDTVVLDDISELFSLPTDFAACLDQAPWLNQEKALQTMVQGGMLFLRPCKAVAEDMLRILRYRPKLRFTYGNAEQEFLSWYFRYSAWLLPDHYNTMNRPALIGNFTRSGLKPKVVHFTSGKPFSGIQSHTPGSQFLCSSDQLLTRLKRG